MENRPIVFIIPWYGDDIRGGAEMECNYLAHSLSDVGYPVEVFTSCVKDAASDRGTNTIEPGNYQESGITVRRFKVREQRNLDNYNQSNLRIYNNDNFTKKDEKIYFEEDINSPDMYEYITKHKDKYRVFIFMPYLYGITFNGSNYCEDKSILIPCLHDESYAYMDILKRKMNSFKGMVFLSKPEKDLAERLYGLERVKKKVLGAEVETGWQNNCDAERFRDKFKISGEFILYAGRKDPGKKADELIEFFLKYKEESNSDLKLIMIGGGALPVEIPYKYQMDVIDLGFVSVEDKHDAFAACTLFCNPSYYESFSIVIMEAWLAKRPVLVSEHCMVTTNFAEETNGGLWFANYEIFKGCINYMIENPKICAQMGENGYQYVMEHFTKEAIANNYIRFIEECGF